MAGPGIFQEDTHRDSRRLAAMHEQIILDGHQAYTICSANGRAARGVFHHGVYPDCDRLAKRNAHKKIEKKMPTSRDAHGSTCMNLRSGILNFDARAHLASSFQH